MKALIKCVLPDFPWTNIFEGVHPYMITFLGKPIIDFYIDYLLLCNVSEITIVVEKYDLSLFKHVHSRSKWGTPIKIEIEEDFTSDSSYNLVCEKFCLLCYDKNFKTRTSFFDALKNSINVTLVENVFRCSNELPPYLAFEISSLKEYFDVNMELLNKFTDGFVMNGYGAEEGVFLGVNDVIMYKTELIPPLAIDNNCLIEGACQIGGSVIMGKLSLIDSFTKIKNCIIYDRTYVGQNLDINNKIIFRQFVIDPFISSKTKMEHSFDLSDSYTYSVMCKIRCIFERLFAGGLLVGLLPFSLLSLIFGKPEKYIVEVPLKDNSTTKISCYKRSKRLRDIYFFKLSQDKLPRLWKCLCGKISLVGDSVQVAKNPKNLKFYGSDYQVGVFNYADSTGKKDEDWKVMDDLHFKNHKTLRTDLQVVLRSLVSRLFGDQGK